MIEHLKPFAEKNAISRVVATVYLSNPFVKPEDVYDRVNSNEHYKKFQKKNLIKQLQIEFNNNSVKKSDGQIIGFMLEEFDDLGLTKSVVRVQNSDKFKASLSLERLKYDRWKDFREQVKVDLISLGVEENLYYDAVGLRYHDDFVWENDDKIDIKKIFNSNSELLNQKFLEAENSTLVFFSQSFEDSNEVEERTEISFSNVSNRISVVHDFIIKYTEPELFKNREQALLDNLDKAHEENKKMLKVVLTKNCQDAIGLK